MCPRATHRAILSHSGRDNVSPEIWSMSTSSMYLWSRFRSAGIMTLPPTMRGLLDAAFFSHQRLLSSITRVPRRNGVEFAHLVVAVTGAPHVTHAGEV